MEQNIMLLPSLRRYGQAVFIFKVIITCLLLLLMFELLISVAFPYCILPQFILGALYAHMIELQHEALHGATQWKWCNRVIGFLLGVPMMISYSDYQYHHMLHHQYVGTEKDTEYFTYSEKKSFSFMKFFLSVFMFEHYTNLIKKIFNLVVFNKSTIRQENVKRKVKNEYELFILLIVLVTAISIVYESNLVLKIWLIPLVFFAAPIHFLMELPEHVFCDKNNTEIFHNTRTIKSNWLMSWFVNGNNYHVEHHYAPHYPISCLSDLHQELKNKIVHFERTYLDFYKSFFKTVLKKV